MRARIALALAFVTGCTAVEFLPRRPIALDRRGPPAQIDPAAPPLASAMPTGSAGAPPAPVVPSEAKLANGIRVIVLENHKHPIVAVAVVLQRGSVEAPAGVFDLFVDSMSNGGSGEIGWHALRRDLYDYAVLDRVSISREWSLTSAQFIAPLLSDVVRMVVPAYATPSFDPEQLETLVDQHKRRASRARDEPAARARRELLKLLFPADDPYAADVADVEHPLEGVTRDAVRELYACVGADDVAVVAVGDVTQAALLPLLEKALGSMKSGARARKAYPEVAAPTASRVVLLDHPHDSQAQIALGFGGVAFDDPDYPALFFLSRIVQDGMRASLRLAHGSTYGTSVQLRMMHVRAPIILSAAVDKMLAGQAITDTFVVLKALDARLARPGELERLKNAVLDNYLSYDTVDEALAAITPIAALGLPVDHLAKLQAAIGALRADDLVRVARKYLDPARAQLVVLGDAVALRGDLESLGIGPVEDRKVAH